MMEEKKSIVRVAFDQFGEVTCSLSYCEGSWSIALAEKHCMLWLLTMNNLTRWVGLFKTNANNIHTKSTLSLLKCIKEHLD